MTIISDYAMARSVRAAARFYALADHVSEKGVEREPFSYNAYKIVAKEGFVPDEEWEHAVFDFYCELSRAVGGYLEIWVHTHEPVDRESVRAWQRAWNRPRFEKDGWVSRIVNVMNAYRVRNDAARDMGDIEHQLMMEAVRKGRQRNMRAHNGL